VIAPCAAHIPLNKIPAHVVVVRGGRRLHKGLFLRVGDRIFVRRPAALTFSYGGNRYLIPHATLTLSCRSLRIGITPASPATRLLAVDLESGEVRVRRARTRVRRWWSAERCWRSPPPNTENSSSSEIPELR
jgi:hypothetical protein